MRIDAGDTGQQLIGGLEVFGEQHRVVAAVEHLDNELVVIGQWRALDFNARPAERLGARAVLEGLERLDCFARNATARLCFFSRLVDICGVIAPKCVIVTKCPDAATVIDVVAIVARCAGYVSDGIYGVIAVICK